MIIGIGTDVVDIARVERMFSVRRERMLQRLFTEGELSYLNSKAFPARHMAARLAAKEAAFKALSGNDVARAIGWRDIEVCSRDDGAPMLRLHGRAAVRFAELEALTIHVSLTHSDTTAVAFVVLER